MDFAIKPSIQKFVEEEVTSGRFANVDAVVEEALTRMMEDEACAMDDETLDAIDESEDQIAQCRPKQKVRKCNACTSGIPVHHLLSSC